MKHFSKIFYKNPRTISLRLTLTLVFAITLALFPPLLSADNNSINGTCPGEIIGEINGASGNISHTENGSIGSNGNDRYRMSFPTAGTLDISAINRNSSRNATYKFYVSRNSCGNSDANWNIISGQIGKSHSTSVSVNAGDTIYVRLQSVSSYAPSGRHEYSLTLNFTAPPSCSPLRDSKNLTALDNMYTNASHYNSSSWNVGPAATAFTRAYKFHADSAGIINADLSRIDNNQAKFSISQNSCPTTLDNLTSSQFMLNSAGSFYVYVYYTNGYRTNIEHQLDILFTPTVPPTVTPATFSISENALVSDTVGTVLATGDPTSFTIVSGADGKFEIDSNGLISVLDTLDYETKTVYTLEVSASNSIGDDTELIVINILDESAPTANDQTFNIDESASNDDLVGTIITTGSPDQFTITSGNTDTTFKLDNTGKIQVNNSSNLDADTTPQYILLVNIANNEGSVDINVTINVDSTLPQGNDNRRDFTNVSLFGSDSISINGNILLIGNQLICKNSKDGAACQEPAVGITNNGVNQHKAKIDTSAGAPSSNTWAKLTLEDGTTNLTEADNIIFARLYWSARISDSTVDDHEKNQARTIQIKGPKSSSYTTLTSPVSRFNWYKSGSTFDYSASQDVTAYVQSNGAGNYSVGGIKASNGGNMFASWALVVIVENPERDLNNLSVYDGFQAIYNGSNYPTSVTVPASGFLTPVGSEPFGASLFVYTGESESGLKDTAAIQNASGVFNNLKDGYGNTNDVFNASIYTPEKGFRSSHSGEANPNFKNVVGTDIDKLEVNRKADASKQFLNNSQTSTNIKITSGGDRYTLNMFAFETELHYPKMCYDYSYSQDNFIYTELNDGTQFPQIDIPTNSGNPVTVTIYVRSEDSDVDFDHVSLHSDHNLSEISYNRHFQRTAINAFGYQSIETEYTSSNCLESASSSSICRTTSPAGNFRVGIGHPNSSGNLGYPLMSSGKLQDGDFMYFKYQITPNNSHPLKTPLNLFADIQYSLTSGGAPVDPVYNLPFGGDRMPLCPPSTSYIPEWGMFNVIDTQLNTTKTGYSGSRYLNNLLTQVSERSFSADVVAYNPVSSPPNDPQDINTSIAVELVDIKGFHDVNISCKEPAIKFSERFYLNFSEENRKRIDFITTPYAKEDAAFRIWYIHDGNTSNIINNWYSKTDASGALLSVHNLYEQIPDAPDVCYGSCNGDPTIANIRDADCYECLRSNFGYPLCSRDNFAIRPESYHILLKDVNTTTASTLNISDNIRANTIESNLSTGYDYILDINSTNHIDSNNTIGYNKQFQDTQTTSSFIRLLWQDYAKVCNDTTSPRYAKRMTSGLIINSKLLTNEAGHYQFQILDDEWTSIDQGQPIHHVNNEFWITNTDDCVADTSYVLDSIATTTFRPVGCNIDSNHTVDRSVTKLPALTYHDLNITYKPYKLSIDNLQISHGPDFNTTFSVAAPFSYVYMSDLSKENNMSVNITGTIQAQGKDGVNVTNFTNSCYGQSLDIELLNDSSIYTDSGRFTHHYIDLNVTSPVVSRISTSEDNVTKVALISSFQDDAQGVSSLRLHYNYDRNVTTPLNPKRLLLDSLDINCTVQQNCTMIAEQNLNYNSQRSTDINRSLAFYYGRTNAPRQRFIKPVGTTASKLAIDFIYYEIHCDLAAGCQKNILPNPTTLRYNDDSRWYVNSIHNSTTINKDGRFGDIAQKVSTPLVTPYIHPTSSYSITGKDNIGLVYDGTKGYPYKATMEHNSSSWLIYNRYDISATKNEFEVEFEGGAGDWSGKHETNTTTKSGGTSKTNRRSMW